MPKVASISSRKSDHLRINLEEDVASTLTTGLEHWRFQHQALPELDLAQVDLSQILFGRNVKAPLLVSSMTGGTEEAQAINLALARAAQEYGLAMGLGSMRAAIENESAARTFQVRRAAPDILLFANLGAVQLNYGYGLDECKRAVDLAEADALVLHLNPLQEALQPEGDTNFSGLLGKIEAVCRGLPVPVIVKEVGWGINGETARHLVDAGVACIDVAGAGGTSWSQVEMHRAESPLRRQVAGVFRNWGIPTAECLRQVTEAVPGTPLIASGGLRSGLDIAKCIALGACLGGIAGPLLRAVNAGETALSEEITAICEEIRVCMFATGAPTLPALQQVCLVEA